MLPYLFNIRQFKRASGQSKLFCQKSQDQIICYTKVSLEGCSPGFDNKFLIRRKNDFRSTLGRLDPQSKAPLSKLKYFSCLFLERRAFRSRFGHFRRRSRHGNEHKRTLYWDVARLPGRVHKALENQDGDGFC